MEEFLQTLYMEADIESILRRFRLRGPQLETFRSFDEINLYDFNVGRFNRWSIAIDAVRAENAFRNAEIIYGERLFTIFAPLASVCYLQYIARCCKETQVVEAVQLATGMNAFAALVNASVKGEPQAYLGRAGLALQSYGLTLTAHLPQLSLPMEQY